jgi:outer membrane murein-binding lipoprotein Lpp
LPDWLVEMNEKKEEILIEYDFKVYQLNQQMDELNKQIMRLTDDMKQMRNSLNTILYEKEEKKRLLEDKINERYRI